MMIGHEFLAKEFGVKPKIGWDLDTFGHSDTNTRLYAEMGFDAMFFSRIEYQERKKYSEKENQHMKFIWRPSSRNFGD
jgi:alpha-mannosidase